MKILGVDKKQGHEYYLKNGQILTVLTVSSENTL
jgi:hypothetical protein